MIAGKNVHDAPLFGSIDPSQPGAAQRCADSVKSPSQTLPRLARYPPAVAPSTARFRPPDLAGDCQRQRFDEFDVPRQDEGAVVVQNAIAAHPRGSRTVFRTFHGRPDFRVRLHRAAAASRLAGRSETRK